MIKTSLDLLLKSSEIDLKYFLEFFGKCLETFMWPSDNFWRIVENLRKVVGNLRNSKIAKNVLIMISLFIYYKYKQYIL